MQAFEGFKKILLSCMVPRESGKQKFKFSKGKSFTNEEVPICN
jgi:hypothetical protein